MGRLGSTTTVRAREMRRVLRRWERSGLTLCAFAPQCGIPVSTLSWWRRVLRGAEEEAAGNDAAVANGVAFTEVPQPAKVPRIPAVVEIILHSGHVVRVPAGADSATLQRVLQALATTRC